MRTLTQCAAGLVLASLVLGATAGESDNEAKPPKKPRYTVVEVADGGSITGVVKFTGKAPEKGPVTVTTSEEICHADPIFAEDLVVADDGGVQWAVASIKKIREGKAFPEEAPSMSQIGCVFTPHVVVTQAGKNVLLLNDDGVLHNVHSWPKKNRSINIAMPGSVTEMKTKFRRAETVRVTCDVHPWMIGWFVSSDHPYNSVTNENGEFSMSDVPPGTYTIELWHETLGSQEQTVTVESGKATQIDFTFSTIPAQDG